MKISTPLLYIFPKSGGPLKSEAPHDRTTRTPLGQTLNDIFRVVATMVHIIILGWDYTDDHGGGLWWCRY